ncbi:hypothetical protein [Haladaptatus sp. CMSO5]|uniref:hypothetical protein n=1 Tax=Haladaptatus sp. CMSO5 TaxID=3120514 RepID=UPI002FCE1E5C
MSDGDSDIGTEDTMRERADESALKIWLLMGANRFVVMGTLAAAVFASFIVVSTLIDPSLQTEVKQTDTIETIFSTLLGLVVTGTTLVVSISQLVLSQENGPVGDQRARMSDALDFRTYVRELLGTVAPADPSALLQALVDESERRATGLYRVIETNDNDELQAEINEFVESIRGNAETVSQKLDDSRFGSFSVLFAALDFNYSWKIYQIDRLTDKYEADLSDAERAAFSELSNAIAMFGPTREHIKTLYFQWALVDLSRYILFAAIPALIISGLMLTFVGASSFPGSTLGVPNITWVVSAAFTIAVIPFLLFTSYIFRIATVAKRTLAIGPLILRESQR